MIFGLIPGREQPPPMPPARWGVWWRDVDSMVWESAGRSSRDFVSFEFLRQMFAQGMEPEDAAKQVLFRAHIAFESVCWARDEKDV